MTLSKIFFNVLQMNQRRKERLLEIAKKLQGERTGRNLHFSFILKNNNLICWAINNYEERHLEHIFGKYSPHRKENHNYIPGRHSECEVIKTFIKKFNHSDMSGLTLYNLRIHKNGSPMNSKPCPNCQREIIMPLNWKEVLWSTEIL